MRNSEAFLAHYSKIEKWLRTAAGVDRAVGFSALVSDVARRNRAVERFRLELREYADLRNAIIHESTDGHVIAEPSDRAVADLGRICKTITDPPTVIPKFQKPVKARGVAESIGDAVRDMRQNSFSQLPILQSGSVEALLTSETVSRWLANEIDNDVVSLSETKISEVLVHAEDSENYCLLSRKATLVDALSQFENFAARGKDLDAILVTNDGNPAQALLGIITLFDLPAILRELGLKRVAAA